MSHKSVLTKRLPDKTSKLVLTKRLPDKTSKAVLTKCLPDKTSADRKYHSAEFVQIVQNSICDETVVQAFDSAHKQSAGLILLTVT